jgi:hypothetical protein
MAEAAVEDAHEAVGERSQGSVVGVAAGAVFVVERSCAGAGVECGERPLVARVSETFVAGVAGEHDLVLARKRG